MGSQFKLDFGGLTVMVKDLEISSGPGVAGTALSATDLAVLSGISVTQTQIEAAAATPSATTTTVDADDLVIPVTHQYVAKTSGADAEACTLADGTPGQILVVELAADGGGDATVTPTTATGFVAFVLADAGDVVTLRFIDDTAGWVILGAFGATAQPAITQS